MHAGMPKKPLVKYHPTSYRNRLPEPTVVMPHKNSSQVTIGDRSSAAKAHFTTTSKNHYTAHSLFDATTNPAVLAERTKIAHKDAGK